VKLPITINEYPLSIIHQSLGSLARDVDAMQKAAYRRSNESSINAFVRDHYCSLTAGKSRQAVNKKKKKKKPKHAVVRQNEDGLPFFYNLLENLPSSVRTRRSRFPTYIGRSYFVRFNTP
jgi:hypothetical protein